MNRSFVVLVLATAAGNLAGCNNTVCGPGTKLVQIQGGVLQCRPADALPDAIPCNGDLGAEIIGGQCVSHITCGTGTMLDPTTGSCISTGPGTNLPACPPPASGTICLHGLLHNVTDNSLFTTTDLKVSYYDPLAFINSPGSPPIKFVMSSNGGYVMSNVQKTSLGYIAITTGDFADEGTYIVAATGDQGIVNNQTYRVDAYVVPQSVTAAWKTQSGVDYATLGAYMAIFYAEKAPAITNLADDEKTPVAGVTFTSDIAMSGTQAPVTNAQYFSTSLTTIDPLAKSTGTSGGAILPTPPMMKTPNFSGSGGMVGGKTPTWETELGGTVPNVIFVSRYHAM
jgi:hypothetical protein